jgi:tRNA dimethylallyltransferase
VSAGRLIVVTGPTASGKTHVAIELARALDGELVGADSVQVYRGFDIGSSKPTPRELGAIRHHLIDVCEPNEELDAAEYAALADRAITEIRARGRVPIVVGGSGLWLRALLRGLVALPKVDPVLREALHAEARERGSEALHQKLCEVDPIAAARIHPRDEVRIVRALEVLQQTGKPLGTLRAEHALGAPRYDALRVVLDLPNDLLHERIRLRTDEMFALGFLDEVRRLLARHGSTPRALASVGYREVVSHLTAGVPLSDTVEAVARATRIYARRQRTWLKSEPGERWTAPPAVVSSPEGVQRLQHFLENGFG